MADRKVLNKYYPPDYDPSAIPRLRAPKQRQIQSRIMMPMSVQCTQCGEFVYKGKKFNARKEHVAGADYLGIKRWRFYFRCPSCLQEMTFKTDPQNGGYEVERGARRNVEPWREQQLSAKEAKEAQEAEEQDVMRKMENKSKEGRREHELAEVLEEVRERNGRGDALTLDELTEWHVRRKERQEEADDEQRAKDAFNRRIQHRRDGDRDSDSSRGAADRQLASAAPLSIDALDFELSDGVAEESTAERVKAEQAEAAEELEEEREEVEEAAEEALGWARQRRQLLASGLSFASLDEQHGKRTAPVLDERKEGPTVSAGIVLVRKRKRPQQSSETNETDSAKDEGKMHRLQQNGAVREQPSVVSSAVQARPAAVALSSMLSAYDDSSDKD